MGFFTEEIAIDLGTANTLIIHNDKVVINSENYIYALITILGSTFYCIGGLLTLKLKIKKMKM